jgi:hypothetical protein
MSIVSELNANNLSGMSPKESIVPKPMDHSEPEEFTKSTVQEWKPTLFVTEYLRDQLSYAKIDPEADRILEISVARNKLMPICNEHLSHVELRKNMSEWFRKGQKDISFVYFYRSLERLLDPSVILDQLKAHTKAGFIEMTSPLMACVHGTPNATFRGNPLNMHVMWPHEGVLHILPKHPIYPLLSIRPEFEEETRTLLIDRPHYQTTFYTWNEEHPLQYEIHYMDTLDDLNAYNNLFRRAIEETMGSSNAFFTMMLERLNAKPS